VEEEKVPSHGSRLRRDTEGRMGTQKGTQAESLCPEEINAQIAKLKLQLVSWHVLVS
jgi:hypothetical protein